MPTPSQAAHEPPHHIVTVSGFITNERDEVLLIRTYWRVDTWEIPGGQVEEGEALHDALIREVREETGIEIEPQGITGVYANVQRGLVNIVFRGRAVGGECRMSEETQEVRFVPLTPDTVEQWITRPHFRSRTLDAMNGVCVPYEAYENSPYQLLKRI